MCMRFWTHMYGNGVGSLSISISDTKENIEREIWHLSGESGNAWYLAEVPVSSPNTFKVMYEYDLNLRRGKSISRYRSNSTMFCKFFCPLQCICSIRSLSISRHYNLSIHTHSSKNLSHFSINCYLYYFRNLGIFLAM